MKSIVSASIDTLTLQEFRLKHTDKKLSSVLNNLLKGYMGVTTTKSDELQLKQEQHELSAKISELQAKQMEVDFQLQKIRDSAHAEERIKDDYWHQVIQVKFPNFSREKYDAHYKEHFYEKAHRYKGNKK